MRDLFFSLRVTVIIVALLPPTQQALLGKHQTGLGSIDGTVVDDHQQLIKDARVYALPDNNRPEAGIRRETATDALGRFHLDSIPAGNATVHADKPQDGYPDTSFAFFVTNSKSVPAVSVSEGRITTVTITLGPKGAWLTGSVVDAETGSIVRDASFTLTRSDNLHIWISTAPVDETGHFSLLVPSGVGFRLRVSSKEYRTWQFGGNNGRRLPGIVTLQPGSKFVLGIALLR